MMRFLLALLMVCFITPSAQAKVEELRVNDKQAVWMFKDTMQPIFTLRLVFTKTGYAYDDAKKQGLAAMAVSLLEEGAGEKDALSFKRALDEKAIKLSESVDADHVYITLTSLSEHQAAAMELLTEMLTRPRMDEADITRIKQQTKSSLKRMLESPEYLASRAWMKAYFGTHPYAQERLGTPESIDGLSQDELKAYIKRSFTRGNMVASVAGDVDKEALKTQLQALLEKLPADFSPAKTLVDATPPSKAEEQRVEFNVLQTVIQFGGLGLKRSDKNYIAAFVLNDIVGGNTLKSRLGEEIRNKSGLTYGINTGLTPMEFAGIWGGAFSTRADKAQEAVGKLKAVLADIATKGITESELQDAKDYLTGSFALSLDTNAELTSFMTAMQLNNLGMDYLEKRNSLIRAVTKQEVDAIARTYITPDAWPLVRVGKP